MSRVLRICKTIYAGVWREDGKMSSYFVNALKRFNYIFLYVVAHRPREAWDNHTVREFHTDFDALLNQMGHWNTNPHRCLCSLVRTGFMFYQPIFSPAGKSETSLQRGKIEKIVMKRRLKREEGFFQTYISFLCQTYYLTTTSTVQVLGCMSYPSFSVPKMWQINWISCC